MVRLLEKRYLTADMISKPIKFTVSGSGIDAVFDKNTNSSKKVIYLHGVYADQEGVKEIDFRLNTTNQARLKENGFDDTDLLEGSTLEISPEKVQFKSEKRMGLRITAITDLNGKTIKIKE